MAKDCVMEENGEDCMEDVVTTNDANIQKMAEKNREKLAMRRSYSIENGYPNKTRSLVGDAKFETLVRQETRKSLLEAARQKSTDLEEADEEEVFLLDALSEEDLAKDSIVKVTVMVKLNNPMIGLDRIIKIVENEEAVLVHLETREPHNLDNSIKMEVLMSVDIAKDRILHLIKTLRHSNSLAGATLLAGVRTPAKSNWFPTHISELDKCNHILTKLEPELDMDHPGWSDKEYRARRKIIADISFNYTFGDKIPDVDYTPDEVATWGAVYSKVQDLLPRRACSIFRKNLTLLEKGCGFSPDNIPQLEDVSNFLKKISGFSLRPAAGLVTSRDFLYSLAFRVFQCTQYVRHTSSPHYSPEPDVIHELIGHVAMFADPTLAQFSQDIGLASLGATDEEIVKLATLYWFTVEFGLCKENGAVRAYGAGMLSSYGELLHALSDKPNIEYRPFDPATCCVQEYDDQAYQDVYFVANSVDDARQKFRRWTDTTLTRPFNVRYNPYTQSVEVLDTYKSTQNLVQDLKMQIHQLSVAFDNITK